MSDAEVGAFLAEQRTVICATAGRDGWPHLMPLWYVIRGGTLWSWTYAASQKVRNLERDARASLQVEDGTEYQELRGVMIKSEARIHRDPAIVRALGEEIFRRYTGAAELAAAVATMVTKQALKRVGLEFSERSRVTWDHRKLGGTY
ncbi:MAG: PPOX class F420-dependent oxidoreductase [Solirubrobacteraceae bacterium]